MKMLRIIAGTCLTAALALPAAAIAQAPPAPATPPAQTAPPNPERTANCAPTHLPPNQNGVKPGTTTGQSAEPLGDRLAKSGGVLCPPPGIDSDMRAPTPNSGDMPVIPPPGSPGGDQSVRPK